MKTCFTGAPAWILSLLILLIAQISAWVGFSFTDEDKIRAQG